jgi:NADPH:quinone reductase-like Zn-dependent oxidoreductase
VLVNGATGAIGSAALQLLKNLGAEVTAVCDTKNIPLISALGADSTIDYTKEDFTKTTAKFHFIFDTVGKSSFNKCKPIMEKAGVYMSSELGYMAQNPFLALATPIFGGKKVKFPIPLNAKRSLLFIKNLLEKGKFQPVIDRRYSLEQTADAFRYVETGQKTGNVILEINPVNP